jgi:hypothetical protein
MALVKGADLVFDVTDPDQIKGNEAISLGGGTLLPATNQCRIYCDFFSSSSTPAEMVLIIAGTGTLQITTGEQAHPGILTIGTGAAVTGRGAVTVSGAAGGTTQNAFLFGGGARQVECLFDLSNLSTGAEEYYFEDGFFTSLTAALTTNGAAFVYDRATDGDFWTCLTAAGGVITKTVTTIPVVPNVWIKHKVAINDDATRADFYHNDVIVASHTTNIPKVAGQETSGFLNLRKTVGGTARSTRVDYVEYLQNFLVAR